MSEPDTSLFPIFLNVADLPILIVGGGAVAARRARSLLEAGARRVTVVAPDLDASMPADISHIPATFNVEHLSGQRLVLAATDSGEVNQRVWQAARERGLLCGRADAGEEGDFMVPGMRQTGGIVWAISTGAPGLTRAVAGEAEPVLERWAALAGAARSLRPTLRALEDPSLKQAALADLATPEAAEIARNEGLRGVQRWLIRRYPALGAHFPEASLP